MEHKERDKPWNFHTCWRCPYRSRFIFLMRNHVGLHHNKAKTAAFKCETNAPEMLKCEHCTFETDLKVGLQHHMNLRHGEWRQNYLLKNILKPYKCIDCDFETHALLVATKHRHNFGHTIDENTKEEYSHSGKFKHHFEIGWYKCKQCAYKSRFHRYLENHISLQHADPHDLQCLKCKRCTHKRKEKHNLKGQSPGGSAEAAKLFECDECGFKTKHKVYLKRHMKVHPSS